MENKSYDDVVGSAAAPYANRLAKACGLAANYHAVAHPSLPNYIAATSGATHGIADDDPPAAHPLRVASIYSQVEAAGKTGIKVAAQIPYNANGTDVSPQVLQMKELKPDAVIFISYTSDTILYLRP